ncbi:MAG: hypothetical protein N2652_06855 [Kiritimatiellae bacterium]|nr:hypothetical protein [Kiritimatiellia bacterium]
MKHLRVAPLAALGALALATAAGAQAELRLRLAHSIVLHMESILATVTIENGTPDEFAVGETNGNCRLRFDIEAAPGRLIPRTDVPMFRRIAVIPPFKAATLEFDLLRLYEIRSPGAYAVSARLHGPAGMLVSGRQFLDVVPGLELLRVSQTAPDQRRFTYQLRTLGRNRQEHLFLRVDEDAAELCHGVFDLGPHVRLLRPLLRFDRLGRVHVLHQSAPGRFTHSVFEADGTPVQTMFWSSTPAEIELRRTEDGDIVVAGARPYEGDRVVAPLRVQEPRPDSLPTPATSRQPFELPDGYGPDGRRVEPRIDNRR